MSANASILFLFAFIQVAISLALTMIPGDGGSLINSIVSPIISVIISAALIITLSKNVAGEASSVKDISAKALSLTPSLLLLVIITGLFVAGGFILFVIPGIIFAIWSSFAIYILVLEGVKGFAAMAKSSAYVSGYALGIFGRSLLVGILTLVPLFAAKMIINGSLSTPSPLADAIIAGAVTPFAVCFSFLLFKNIVAIKTTAVIVPANRSRLIKIFSVIGVIAIIAIPLLIGTMIASNRMNPNLAPKFSDVAPETLDFTPPATLQ
jgi:hypothetical protein